jgi:hypothetical protein
MVFPIMAPLDPPGTMIWTNLNESTIIPAETLRPDHEQKVEEYLGTLLNYSFTQMHFFDEASIITTSGNCRYGHSYLGERAVEVQ